MGSKKTEEKICEFCGRSNWRSDSMQCIKCKSEYTEEEYNKLGTLEDQNPSKKFIRASYSDWIGRVDQYMPILKNIVNDCKPRSAIDVGCGPNRLLRRLVSEYPEIIVRGYDIYLRDEDIVKIDFEKNPIPYDDFPADLSICSHVLEHIEDLHGILDQMLLNSKSVFIAIPNTLFFKTFVKSMLGKDIGGLEGIPFSKPMDRHRWMYTVKEADRFMQHCAGKHGKKLDIYYISPYIGSILAKVNKNMFVSEMIYVFTAED